MNRWELPEGWEWTTIGAVGEVRLGRQRTPEHHSGPNMRPYLRVANVHEGRIDTSDVKEMNFTDAEFEIFKLREGDVLLNEGQSKEFVGRPAIFKGEVPGACFQNTLVRFRASKDVNPEYAYQLFRHYMHAGHFQEIAKITTSIAHLGGDRFASRPFPLPPLQEQTRIAERLNALQARSTTARGGLDELRQLATALKRAVLDAAFRGELTAAWREAHPDAEPASALLDRLRAERRRRWQEAHPGKPYKDVRTAARGEVADSTASALEEEMLPETWQMARLRDVVTLQAGYAFKSEWYTDAGVRLLRGINIIPGATRWDDVVHLGQVQSAEFEEYSLNAGDIVIAMDRPLVADGLKVARLAAEDLPALLLQRVGRFQRSSAIHGDFLFAYLHSSYFLHQVSGQATGTQLPHISGNDIEAAPVPIPPLEEQRQIGAQIHRMFQTIAALQHALNASYADLTTTEHALLAAAFRGELLPLAAP